MAEKVDILFKKFIGGTCTRQEFDELMELLKNNSHESEFRDMLHEVYSSVERDDYADTDILYKPQSGKNGFLKVGWKRGVVIISSLAACLALAIIAGAILKLHTWRKPQEQGYVVAAKNNKGTQKETSQHTGRAEKKHLVLPDGTQVWLNAESRLDVPQKFADDKRIVTLSGEAFFDVKHADKWPFIIHTSNGVSTRVLGTAFDIKAYVNQALSVSVKRGRVQVSKNQKVLATLSIGQQIKITPDPAVTPAVTTVKEDNIASWTEGKLSYDGMRLEDIIDDLQRVYNVRITLGNSLQGKEVITVAFNKGDGLEAVLKTLCLLINTTYTVQGNNYIIH